MNHHKIVFVSRLDADCSLGAQLLCEIAPQLAQKYPNLQIIIIGGGTEYSKIQRESEQINAKLNRGFINTVGSSLNPSEYFDKNTLFVGVSRAALEAMARGVPTILLGNEGYFGLLDENNIPFAEKTNFTCRGTHFCKSKSELRAILYNEICRYFELPREKKEHLSTLMQNIVKKDYTARQMAQKTVEVYKKSILKYSKKHPKKIAICGYYGYGNLGDEAILSVIKQNIAVISPNAKICVLHGKNPIKILKTLAHTDLFVFGGGSLLQNSTSNASLFYYLTIIHAAKLLSRRKIMLANGIGPIESRVFSKELLLKLIAKTVDTFDFISVRDTVSQKLLSDTLPHRKINLVPDPALVYKPIPQLEISQKSRFVYIPCETALKNSNIDCEELTKTLKLVQKTYTSSLVVAILNPQKDMEIGKKIASRVESSEVVCPASPDELFSLFKKAKFAISQRYHGSLFALSSKTPVLPVSNDPKMHALCRDFCAFPCQKTKILSTPSELCKALSLLSDSETSRNCHKKRVLVIKSLEKIIKKYLNTP